MAAPTTLASLVSITTANTVRSAGFQKFVRNEKVAKFANLFVTVFPPICTIVALSVLVLIRTVSDMTDLDTLNEQCLDAGNQYVFIKNLQVERGLSIVYASARQANREQMMRDIMGKLTKQRQAVDNTLLDMERWTITSDIDRNMLEMISPATLVLGLRIFRERIDTGLVSTTTNITKWYTDRIRFMFYKMARTYYEGHGNSRSFWGRVNAMLMSVKGHDSIGVKRALGSGFFSVGSFNKEKYRLYSAHDGLSHHAEQYVTAIMTDIEQLRAQQLQNDVIKQLTHVIDEFESEIFLNDRLGSADVDKSIIWFDNVTDYLQQVSFKVDNALSDGIDTTLEARINDSWTLLCVTLVLVISATVICPMVLIWYNKSQRQIEEQHAETSKAKHLLHQMLPRSIATQLQAGEEVLPEIYEEVTVYFSDVVGFTALNSKSSPMEVVYFLNLLFQTMDDVIDTYKVYKVETIGDAYMVAAGVPRRAGKQHSAEVCTMALAMLRQISMFHIPHIPHETVLMRIGINTGPLAAGVVGIKMPRYCLFGDTVNCASRMESTGLPMRIQISEDTACHLRAHHKDKFMVEKRGALEVKGKGTQQTYWLLGKIGFNYTINLEAAQAMTERATYPYEEGADYSTQKQQKFTPIVRESESNDIEEMRLPSQQNETPANKTLDNNGIEHMTKPPDLPAGRARSTSRAKWQKAMRTIVRAQQQKPIPIAQALEKGMWAVRQSTARETPPPETRFMELPGVNPCVSQIWIQSEMEPL